MKKPVLTVRAVSRYNRLDVPAMDCLQETDGEEQQESNQKSNLANEGLTQSRIFSHIETYLKLKYSAYHNHNVS